MSGPPRILVVGGDPSPRGTATRALRKAGLTEIESVGSVAVDPHDVPGLIVITGEDGAVLCKQAREAPPLAEVPILVVVPPIPADAAVAALSAGADDVLLAPPTSTVIGNRVRRLLERAADRKRARELEEFQSSMLRVQELVARGGDAPGAMRDVLLGVVTEMRFDRASLIAHIEASEYAYVVAATDDPSHQNFTLAVADYPEITQAIRTREPVLIDDAQTDPITASAAEVLTAKGIRGVAVFPVLWRHQPLGVVLFRRAERGVDHVDRDRIAFARLFANMVAAQLRHGTVIERLRDQTRRISRASYEAERRLRTIESLKEHFEASADGIVVLDEHGRILFVNGAAEAITGFARDGLIGTPLEDLVPSSQRDPLREVIDGVLSGSNLEAFDLNVSTTAGQPICVSVTTSTVLSKSGAVILAFRDVTAERLLEGELQQTKDFLEKLINSAVDAIIAADMRGQVILFNPGAERITGYSAEEVVGRLPVWQLYSDGVASQVMRMLRSNKFGGVGRLEQTRREIRTKSGELVPVNMTASIIYEEGREVATVGIFSDLREKLRIEQRLLQAQEQLELQERQAMVAQLAGAAAHELNQPLTSITMYAALIKRGMQPDDSHARAITVIEREAERMADIVKKIGRITRYETKEYVGSASIMDLDKSAAQSGEFLRVDKEDVDGEDEAFEHEATRQFDEPDVVSNPFAGLIGHEDDEERTQPSLRIGPYKEAIERARVTRGQAPRATPEEAGADGDAGSERPSAPVAPTAGEEAGSDAAAEIDNNERKDDDSASAPAKRVR